MVNEKEVSFVLHSALHPILWYSTHVFHYQAEIITKENELSHSTLMADFGRQTPCLLQ